MRAFAAKQHPPQVRASSSLARHHAEERMRLTANGRGQTAAPPIVNEVLATPGRPLDAPTRSSMETRFGHDFSRVRVYSDPRASRSAAAVDARAYTVGEQLVFGRGEYAPGTREGRSLIAHELAHVVQQRSTADPHLMLRRAPSKAKTSAGEFVADPYNAIKASVGSTIVGYGAVVTITFKANENVDARKIAFVQTAMSYKDGSAHNRFSGKKGEVFAGRMVPEGSIGEGAHIDQLPERTTPLYGMGDGGAKDLTGAIPQKFNGKDLAVIGFHYKEPGGVLKNKDAVMHDEPDLSSGDMYTKADDVMKSEWSQSFETTALAIEGNQTGTYYGTVQWGWAKKKADADPRLSEFKAKSQDVPSQTFMEAARLWNASKTINQKETLDLPSVEFPVTHEGTVLWDSSDRRRKLAILSKGTLVGRVAKADPNKRTWIASVKVTSGKHVGKLGWVEEVHLY